MKHNNIALFVPHLGCPHQCSFCNQRVIANQPAPPAPEEVEQELRAAVERLRGNPAETEIAFFGGSFTAIDRELMIQLLAAAQRWVKRAGLRGIRVSTRPDAVDGEILSVLLRYGVTSVELGAQSMDDGVLRQNRRGHTAEQVRRAAGRIRESGLELGLQMMTGLYGSSPGQDWDTARELAALQPDTVRIYPTVVLRGTELARRFQAGEYPVPSLEASVALCAGLLRFFEGQGIRVIKLGLHASRAVEREMIAGGYHPAFRELCESRLYLEQAKRLRAPAGEAVLLVRPDAISKMAGQHRGNLKELEALWGRPVRVAPDAALKPYEVKMREESSSIAGV